MDNTQLTEHVIRLCEFEAGAKSDIATLYRRVDKQDKIIDSLRDLNASVVALAQNVQGLRSEMDDIQAKPAKRWDTVITAVITAVVSITITYLLTKLGM